MSEQKTAGTSDFTLRDVENATESIVGGAVDVESEMENITEIYDGIIDRAESGLPEDTPPATDPESTELSEVGVEDASVDLSSVHRDVRGIDADRSRDFDSDTVGEYIRDITARLDEVDNHRSEIDDTIDKLGEFSDQALGEFLETEELFEDYEDTEDALSGSFGQKLEQYRDMSEGRQEMKEELENTKNLLSTEEEALERELTEVVNSYASEMYDRVADMAENLGGTERPNEGEIELLKWVSSSRAELLEAFRTKDSDDFQFVNYDELREHAEDKSREALEAQAYMVANVAAQLGQAFEGIDTLIDQAEDYVDSDRLNNAYDALENMKEGYRNMGDIVDDEESYESLGSAVAAIMQQGMAEDEELESRHGYNLQMDEIPYLGSQDAQASSE